jgi:integrase/recombinase XerD
MKLTTYLKTHYTPQTQNAYKREIERFISTVENAEISRHKDIVGYIGVLREKGYTSATLKRILASIKAYFDYLVYIKKRKDNPSKSVYLKDKQNRSIQLQDLFTPEELESLMERKNRYYLLGSRNKVLTSLLIYQALLPNELTNLEVENINLEKAKIYIKGSSKNNARELPLKPKQILLFYEYIHHIRPKLLEKSQSQNTENKLLITHKGNPESVDSLISHFKSYKNHFTDQTGKPDSRKLNMRTIRQSVITNLLSAGNDLRMVQVFAGHKYPSATENYKQTNVEELKKQVLKYHPLG